jgi:hypothetical protein
LEAERAGNIVATIEQKSGGEEEKAKREALLYEKV